MQFILRSEDGELLELDPIGDVTQERCQSFSFEEGVFLDRFSVSYNADIRHVFMEDSTFRTMEVGRKYLSDTVYEWDFNKHNRLVGLSG